MDKVCKKCGYGRRAVDESPDYQCPQCGAVYAKTEAYIERIERSLARENKPDRTAAQLQTLDALYRDTSLADLQNVKENAAMPVHAAELLDEIIARRKLSSPTTSNPRTPRHFSHGTASSREAKENNQASEKRILPAFLLCFFFGIFGGHRFYAGKIGTGFIQLALGIILIALLPVLIAIERQWLLRVPVVIVAAWYLIDFVMIIVGSFADKSGRKITQWT